MGSHSNGLSHYTGFIELGQGVNPIGFSWSSGRLGHGVDCLNPSPAFSCRYGKFEKGEASPFRGRALLRVPLRRAGLAVSPLRATIPDAAAVIALARDGVEFGRGKNAVDGAAL